MDIEELRHLFLSEKKRIVINIEKEYLGYIKKLDLHLRDNLRNKIIDYFQDAEVSKLDKFYDNEFSFLLFNNENKSIKDLSDILDDLIYSTIRELDNSSEESKINSDIDYKLEVINRTVSFKWINEYINGYLAKIKSYFYYQYKSSLLSERQIEDGFTDLKEELRKYLIDEINKVDSAMKKSIKDELSSLSIIYKTKIHEFLTQSNKVSFNVSAFQSIIEMAGLKLVSEGIYNYIVNPTTNEKHMLEENGHTVDEKYIVLANGIGEFSIGDNIKNVNIISDNLTTKIIKKDTNDRIKIEYSFSGYEFTVNDRLLEDPEDRKNFLIMLYHEFPSICQHICSEPFFGPECKKIIDDFIEGKTSNNEKTSIDENTQSLLNELEQGQESFDQVLYPVIDQEESIITDSDISLDDEIFKLEQDPIVQKYIELKKLQAERKESQGSMLL